MRQDSIEWYVEVSRQVYMEGEAGEGTAAFKTACPR